MILFSLGSFDVSAAWIMMYDLRSMDYGIARWDGWLYDA